MITNDILENINEEINGQWCQLKHDGAVFKIRGIKISVDNTDYTLKEFKNMFNILGVKS